MHLSVIVPAFNEELDLEKNIKKYLAYLQRQSYQYEIIIINDGSHDRTAGIAAGLAREFPQIKFINNAVNQGKGAAVRQGLLAGQGKYRLFIDADGATAIEHTDKIWPYFAKGFDVVIGSRNWRDVNSACQKIKQPLWKRCLGTIGNYLVQLLTIRGIWDTQCGFKAFTDAAVKKIAPKMTIKRWMFDVEVLLLAKQQNLKIAIIPVIWENSWQSRVGIKGYFISLKEILRIKWRLLAGKY